MPRSWPRTPKLRVVLDTNLLVSALLLSHSIPAQAFRKIKQQGTMLFSEASLAELTRVVSRPKFDRYVSLELRHEFVLALAATAELIVVLQPVQACRDPQDNLILEVAINGKADLIITGDRDLLALHPFGEIPIRTPAEYLVQQA